MVQGGLILLMQHSYMREQLEKLLVRKYKHNFSEAEGLTQEKLQRAVHLRVSSDLRDIPFLLYSE